jgi:hypothetical protein
VRARRKPAVALTGPRITTLIRRAPASPSDAVEQPVPSSEIPKIPETRPVIVTAKDPRRGRFGDVPDMMPEEHERRGDAAVALFRELTRRVRGE